MLDFFKRLGSYNLFNNLFPGVIFAYVGEQITYWNLTHNEIIASLFFCYFYGLIISRMGSLLIEPFFKMLNLIQEDRSAFIKACKSDIKLPVLLETRNIYRSILALILALLLLRGASNFVDAYPSSQHFLIIATIILLVVLLCFSFIKQNKYIYTRALTTVSKKEKGE